MASRSPEPVVRRERVFRFRQQPIPMIDRHSIMQYGNPTCPRYRTRPNKAGWLTSRCRHSVERIAVANREDEFIDQIDATIHLSGSHRLIHTASEMQLEAVIGTAAKTSE